MADSTAMDMDRVMELLPHRYPFLLVDRVLECRPGESLRALKNVTVNEPFFQGHFPGRPVMPGVRILGALAQACGILAFSTAGEMPGEDTGVYFVGIDKSRFRRPAFPGDQLILEIEFERRIRDIWRFTTRALVEGKVVADARMMVATKGNDR